MKLYKQKINALLLLVRPRDTGRLATPLLHFSIDPRSSSSPEAAPKLLPLPSMVDLLGIHAEALQSEITFYVLKQYGRSRRGSRT
ncbi:hypothetical protein Leryth_004187 [Lithospermum erythrorhizon]|nr:hypothetical protein Leryth_004187 [Lithospermum erythrorhizon]